MEVTKVNLKQLTKNSEKKTPGKKNLSTKESKRKKDTRQNRQRNESIATCLYCEKSFPRKKFLVPHTKIEHGKDGVPCPISDQGLVSVALSLLFI